MVYGIPAGCWRVDGSTLKATHFLDPNAIFSTGASFGPAHESYGVIGANNVADLWDPNGMDNLSRRNICWTLDSMNSRMAALNSGLADNYLIYGTGIVA